jgi:hypothetical protein
MRTHRSFLSSLVLISLLVTACGRSSSVGGNQSVEVQDAQQPLAPASVDEYLSAADRLPVTVAELNRSELFFVNAAKAQGVDVSTLDAGLRAVAAHATEVGLLGSELSVTMAGQEGGEGNADSYAAIARTGFVIALEAQNLRTSVANDPSRAVAMIAEYGARLWNPSVTVEGVQRNPFLPHVQNPSGIDEVKLLQASEAEQITSQAGADREMRTWIALSTSTMTKTVDVPADIDASVDPFNPSVTGSLTDSDGQKDHDRAVQIIVAHLNLLAADSPADVSFLVPRAYAAETKKKTFTMPTGIIPLDLFNFGKENSDAIKQAGNKFIPILTKEMKGLATTAKNTAIQNTVKAAEPEVADFLKGAGVAIPTKKNTIPVKDTTSPVTITIVVDEAEDVSAAEAQKRGYNEGEKGVKFTVSWSTTNTSPFTLSCNGQPVGDQNSAQVSLNWPMKLGAQRITCVALGNGGAVLGSNAVAVVLKETLASSSGAGKSLGFEVSSASAPGLTVQSSSAQVAASSVASSAAAASSSVFIPQKSSSAPSKAQSSAASVDTSSAAAAVSSKGAGSTAWIDPYVDAFAKDLLAKKFDDVAVAIVTEDLRACLYAEVQKGSDESTAKKNCAATLKQQASSTPTVGTLPTVGVGAAFTETITGGPKAAMASKAVLTADLNGHALTGNLTGSATWQGEYYCYNTSDSSEIYQTVSATYVSAYEAQVTGGIGADGSFAVPITIGGTTKITAYGNFTHEECVHLNGDAPIQMDTYAGNGTISGTATPESLWTIKTSWKTSDGKVSVAGSFVGNGSVK